MFMRGHVRLVICLAALGGSWAEFDQLVFNPNLLSWPDAEAHCIPLGGHLATVSSEEMARHIDATFVRAGGACHATWIGYNDRATEGQWVWAGAASSYTNWWQPSEPNNMVTGKDCASLGVDCIYGHDGVGYHWADSGCSPGDYEYHARASLCEVGSGEVGSGDEDALTSSVTAGLAGTLSSACGTKWGRQYVLAESGSHDCSGCGQTIDSYEACGEAAETGAAVLRIGGLGPSETGEVPPAAISRMARISSGTPTRMATVLTATLLSAW